MITVDDIRNLWASWGDDKLSRTNPLSDDGCVYTTETGEHCIAAQTLVELDVPVPEFESEHNPKRFDLLILGAPWDNLEPFYTERPVDTDAQVLLERVQQYADATERITWRKAIEFGEQSYQEIMQNA